MYLFIRNFWKKYYGGGDQSALFAIKELIVGSKLRILSVFFVFEKNHQK